jgi:hypothetical protein
MASERGHLKKLKDYARGRSISDLFALENELSYGTSDRAMAVLMAATLEDTLRDWILSHLRQDLDPDDLNRLFGAEGALGTFSSKTMVAYALTIIGPVTQHDLNLIRNVRNQFAHSRRPLKFGIKEVADVCDHLRFPDLPGVSTPQSYLDSAPNRAEAADPKNPRTRYYMTCHNIAYRMVRLSSGAASLDTTELPAEPLP